MSDETLEELNVEVISRFFKSIFDKELIFLELKLKIKIFPAIAKLVSIA
ncbi:MAG: hypothetical protein ACTS8R_02220 [Arsenophonus sp. NC-QC1-MAG3]